MNKYCDNCGRFTKVTPIWNESGTMFRNVCDTCSQHTFQGRHDRWCEVCNLPDDNRIHIRPPQATPEEIEAMSLVGDFAEHIASRSYKLRVMEVFTNKFNSVGTPKFTAVLTNESGEFFSADLVHINDVLVAAAVNMYGDKSTARYDASRRAGN